ncbi:class I SAM-dependent methyltransferase [Alkalicoccobacillus porphyridii]|uniref:Class I SAM-dependent methyltransferase n=1 Tax=Alkalicoccobacillus porphyridii TaxID=2597270 RepID=A0A553ZXQ2_9BACI|nr:class I SAM-dependent methyltransferase [Alkalicoccobacillus porphyridii]TSB46214.1 class I SAM-dependent methyltransferase [Alkalicoccobacillus porphyridii]
MQYELLMNRYNDHPTNIPYKPYEKSKRIRLLVKVAKLIGTKNTPFFQILLFSKVKNFIRFIILRKTYEYFQSVHIITKKNENDRIFDSFMKLGIQLQVITKYKNTYSLNTAYLIDESDKDKIIQFKPTTNHVLINRLLNDYIFVERASMAPADTKLGKIMHSPNFVYIKEVLKYVQEINELSFNHQVQPSFSEDFYTDLGELAFNIYTKDNYKAFISKKKCNMILDIGCGNGNYIDAHIDSVDKKIVGVERQSKVYEKLQQKYEEYSNVIIHNEDITDLTFEKKFDMINMSYMLFYLTDKQKEMLFIKLKDILQVDGSIIVCQYYPDFEVYQELISKHNNSWNAISRFKYDICNSILSAEVVLNNMLVDFAQAEEWNSFLKLLHSCGFKVSEISPADDTYYSYFITIKHKAGGAND